MIYYIDSNTIAIILKVSRASLESGVLEAEALMKSRKNSQENSNNSE
jgi:hypothetical protein